MFVPLAHPPGQAQADFGEANVVICGVEQKAYFFVMDLPHSDACFVRAYPAATAEAWMDGHVHAFAFFGGVPQSVLYDSEEDQETIRGIVSLTNRCLVSKILPPSRQIASQSPAGQRTGHASAHRCSAPCSRIICSGTATVGRARGMSEPLKAPLVRAQW